MIVVRLLTSNKASDTALAVSVKLDAAGESCSDSSAAVTDLSVCVLTQLSQKRQNWVVVAIFYLSKVILVLTARLTDLCGDSKLGNNLAVGVDSSTKAWPELRWVEKIGTKNIFFCVFFITCCQKLIAHLKERSQFWPKRQLPAAMAPTAPSPSPAPVFCWKET